MIRVLFVCHGNICRSTMSQSVFTYLVRQAGLEDCFEIDSAATSREEIGNPPHYGTRNKLRQVQIPLTALIRSANDGRIMTEGIKTVILGKPNAGKSSLLNKLCGTEKAIVTDIAGTTRDVLEQSINLHGITLNLMDTAGIRDTEDVVEQIGVQRAKKYAKEADLILYVADSSTALDENDEEIIELFEGRKVIILLNKSDLEPVTTEQILKEKAGEHPVICVSAKDETGFEQLEDTLKNMFLEGNLSFNDEVCITNMRHKAALMDAKESLKQVTESIAQDMPEDFFSIDLMSAYESLGTIIGEAVDDDLVNEIFSKFCMGK